MAADYTSAGVGKIVKTLLPTAERPALWRNLGREVEPVTSEIEEASDAEPSEQAASRCPHAVARSA